MCFGALLPRQAPWCPFNQVRSRGEGPSELDLTKIAAFSRLRLPLLRLATLPRPADDCLLCWHLPEIWLSAGTTPRPDPEGPVPLGSKVRTALSAHEALLRSAASLQGLNPSAGWGHRSGMFSPYGTLALLGLASLGRSPSLPSGLTTADAALSAHANNLAGRPSTFRHQVTVSAVASPLGHFRIAPVLGTAPCASEFQRTG